MHLAPREVAVLGVSGSAGYLASVLGVLRCADHLDELARRVPDVAPDVAVAPDGARADVLLPALEGQRDAGPSERCSYAAARSARSRACSSDCRSCGLGLGDAPSHLRADRFAWADTPAPAHAIGHD